MNSNILLILDDMTVHLQSENGILGLGPFPTKDEVNLSKGYKPSDLVQFETLIYIKIFMCRMSRVSPF